LVDTVVYADSFGGGKPSPEAFLEVLARLGANPASSVFAGDDPVRDIEGARAVGMKTVLVRRGSQPGRDSGPPTADAVVGSLAEVPAAAELLVGVECRHVH
jgi:putative hydrolase of the HAD superfamily